MGAPSYDLCVFFFSSTMLKLKCTLVFLRAYARLCGYVCSYEHYKNKENEKSKQRCVLTLDVEHDSVGVFRAQLVFGDALVLALIHLLAVANLQTPCNK